MMSGPDKALLGAVERLGLKCTRGEAAEASGLSMEVAEDELNALMVHANGSFVISGDATSEVGERIIYAFPSDLRARIRSRQRKAMIADACDQVLPYAVFVFRSSMGIFLFLSLAIISLALVILALVGLMALTYGGNGRDVQQAPLQQLGLDWSFARIHAKLYYFIGLWNHAMLVFMICGGGNPFFVPPFLDPFYWGYVYGFGFGSGFRRPNFIGGGYHRRSTWCQPWRERQCDGSIEPAVLGNTNVGSNADAWPVVSSKEHVSGSSSEGSNITDAVFSFLFGDGPPQSGGLAYWRLVACVIRRDGGVTCAAALAPFLEDPPTKMTTEEDLNGMERYITPIIEHYRGQAIVVPDNHDGLIVYKFPELLGEVSAQLLGIMHEEDFHDVPTFYQEGEWVFTKRRSWETQCTAALGTVNLLGVAWMMFATSSQGSIAKLITRGIGNYFATILACFVRWVMLPYAVLFLIVPAIRWMSYSIANRRVRKRNLSRENLSRWFSTQCRNPNSHVKQRLAYASKLSKLIQLSPFGPSTAEVI